MAHKSLTDLEMGHIQTLKGKKKLPSKKYAGD